MAIDYRPLFSSGAFARQQADALVQLATQVLAESASALAVHEAAANPHPQYALASALAAHEAAVDPHPQYVTNAEAAAALADYALLAGADFTGPVTVAGALSATTDAGASHRASYNSASETVALIVENTGGGAAQLRVNTATQSYALRNVSTGLQVYDITAGGLLANFLPTGFVAQTLTGNNLSYLKAIDGTGAVQLRMQTDNTNRRLIGVAASGATKSQIILADELIQFAGSTATAFANINATGVTSKGALFSDSPTAGAGYTTGAGGSVTQTTSKSNNVTLNKPCGRIVMHSSSVAAGTTVSFSVNNSTVGANDTVVVSIQTGAWAQTYSVLVKAVGAGFFTVELYNYSAVARSDSIILNFAVIKGAIS